MKYATIRTTKQDQFFSSTAVLMSEILKLFICLILVFCEQQRNAYNFGRTLYDSIIKSKVDTLKVCLPSLLYLIQNNLLYVSTANLNAVTHQISYQLKILTTAIFAVIILRKKLRITQWCSLVFLMAGVVILQLVNEKPDAFNSIISNGTENSLNETQSRINCELDKLLGFCAVIGACMLSGFSGVYFEKILKDTDVSVWMRNVQLSLLSIPLGTVLCLLIDFDRITEMGFFHDYDWFVAILIVMNASGGLIVALTLKYADNILKGFATSFAIVIVCIASTFIFEFKLTVLFSLGALLVIAAIFLYGYIPIVRKDEENSPESSSNS